MANQCIFLACKQGDMKQVHYLLDHGADVNTVSETGASLLAIAAEFGHVDLALSLLERKCSIDIVDLAGDCALLKAVRGGHSMLLCALRVWCLYQQSILTTRS